MTSFLLHPDLHGIVKTNQFGEKYLYNISRNFFENISSKDFYESEFKEKIFDEDNLYIVIGTDSGLLPRYIQEKGIPQGTRFLFIEPNFVLNQLNENNLLDNLEEQIVCTDFEHWENLAETLKISEYFYINSVKSISSICAQQTILDEYSELIWDLNEALVKLHWRISVSIGYELFIIRQLENLSENAIPVQILENTFTEKTVIILAGGPSLTKILPWVKNNKDKLIIFAISRISRQLIANNIEPDFVFSVDPQDTNIDVSREMFQFSEQTIFINSYHVDKTILSQWHGLNLYLGPRFPWQCHLSPENINGAGPTVTNTALTVAHRLGFERILLAGFDTCFTKEGISHAEGSDEQLSGPDYKSTTLFLETYEGEKRPTEPGLYLTFQALTSQAKIISADNRQIINLAATAAKVEHIEHVPTENIELKLLEDNFKKSIKQKINPLSKTDLNVYYEKILKELFKAKNHIKEINKLSKKALLINEKMYTKEGNIEDVKLKIKMDAIEKQLSKQHKKYSYLVKKLGIRKFIKITSPHDDDSWDADKTKKTLNVYYEAYQTGSGVLLKLTNEAIDRVKSRQEELKESPDFSVLLKQWEKDESFNRANLWSRNHPEAAIPHEVGEELRLAKEKFQKILVTKKTRFKSLAEENASLSFFRAKALNYLKHGKINELIDLKAGLTAIVSNQHDISDYRELASGYIAELQNDFDKALMAYDKVLNFENSSLLEEALLRITSISINREDHQSAFLAFECLASISPVYLPFYAESAKLLGDFLLAIDCYHKYINYFPEDYLYQLKLAYLYFDKGIFEASRMLVSHILEKNPDFESAKKLNDEILKKMSAV